MSKPKFQQLQYQFCQHIKDPDNNPAPKNVEDRRLGVYRELFFNNICGFLDSAFPVLSSLFTKEEWRAKQRRFFSQHHCRSPLFLDISKEYVEYLKLEHEEEERTFPFELELAHYEWVELSVASRIAQNDYVLIDRHELEASVPLVFSELAENLSYAYPVQNISKSCMPVTEAERLYIVLYRNDQNKVKFLQVNALTSVMIELVKISPGIEFEHLVDELEKQIPQYQRSQIQHGALSTIVDLADKGIVRKFHSKRN